MTDTTLICFPGAPNLPIFVADEKGCFKDAGITIDLTTTPSSSFQAENLANGTFQIAGTAFDNVIAYSEGQGAVKIDPAPDFIAFMGATQIRCENRGRPKGPQFGARCTGHRIRLRAL